MPQPKSTWISSIHLNRAINGKASVSFKVGDKSYITEPIPSSVAMAWKESQHQGSFCNDVIEPHYQVSRVL